MSAQDNLKSAQIYFQKTHSDAGYSEDDSDYV